MKLRKTEIRMSKEFMTATFATVAKSQQKPELTLCRKAVQGLWIKSGAKFEQKISNDEFGGTASKQVAEHPTAEGKLADKLFHIER